MNSLWDKLPSEIQDEIYFKMHKELYSFLPLPYFAGQTTDESWYEGELGGLKCPVCQKWIWNFQGPIFSGGSCNGQCTMEGLKRSCDDCSCQLSIYQQKLRYKCKNKPKCLRTFDLCLQCQGDITDEQRLEDMFHPRFRCSSCKVEEM